jgi:hypothetical protein
MLSNVLLLILYWTERMERSKVECYNITDAAETCLDHLASVLLWVPANLWQHLDAWRFLRPVSKRQGHLAMSEWLSGMGTEGQFGTEHSLPL